MNKLSDLIKILQFCEKHNNSIRTIEEKSLLTKESFDDLGITLTLNNGTHIGIYNTCYEIDNTIEIPYTDLEGLFKDLEKLL